MSWDKTAFIEKLANQHTFPGHYLFKFIVPEGKVQFLLSLLPEGELTSKKSSNGNYVSVSLHAVVQTPDQVVEIYATVHHIEGIIAL